MSASLPTTMYGIAVDTPGGPEVMHLAEMPVPNLKPGEVLIRVQAAGVNRPDVQQRKGLYPPPPDASPVLGLEAAGEIVALGDGVPDVKVGDRVTALANGGAYAEYLAVPAAQCLPWPAGYDAIRAAALPETFFTVWANVFELGRLAAGETLLVHGGTSGIGIAAIQIATARGATVYATAGSAEKCDAVRKLGATPINYREQDFAKVLADQKAGVDVVLDMIGASYTMRNLKVLKRGGRLVQVAFMESPKVPDFDLAPVMVKNLTVTGSTMRPRTTVQKGEIAAALQREVWPLLAAQKIAPIVHQVFPLAEAEAAHRLMESSAHIGKIMLAVGD